MDGTPLKPLTYNTQMTTSFSAQVRASFRLGGILSIFFQEVGLSLGIYKTTLIRISFSRVGPSSLTNSTAVKWITYLIIIWVFPGWK